MINMTRAQKAAHDDCDASLSRLERLLHAAQEVTMDNPTLCGTRVGGALLALLDAIKDKLTEARGHHADEWEAAKVEPA